MDEERDRLDVGGGEDGEDGAGGGGDGGDREDGGDEGGGGDGVESGRKRLLGWVEGGLDGFIEWWPDRWPERWLDGWIEAWPGERVSRLSLADKCLALFGGAVVLIVVIASVAPWLRMNGLVGTGQLQLSRERARVWMVLESERGSELADKHGEVVVLGGIPGRRVTLQEAEELAKEDRYFARALKRIDAEGGEYHAAARSEGARVYRYAMWAGATEDLPEGLVVVERVSGTAAALLLVNTAYLFGAGLLVFLLAVLVFYLITHRLILEPVRSLKETAERVRAGRLDTRSGIKTGDEFEDLAETFNLMLADMEHSHDQLQKINTALDLKLSELSKTNSALAEASKLKGEFLAKVSHELRTPLNSIMGFAELLLDIARKEERGAREVGGRESDLETNKRRRYLENIDSASRNLLELIETLLEMAKLEAGRVDVRPEKMSLRVACEGMLGLIYPLAERKGVSVKLEVASDVPMVETDVRKFQQIVFNFLSNAVKFIEPMDKTGRVGEVVLRVELLKASGGMGRAGGVGSDDLDLDAEGKDRVRVSVIDTGPGIAAEDQERVFETFEQAEAAYLREHSGTGLGLPICKELASYIQAEIQLVSELGRGSMFSLIMPLSIDAERLQEMKLEGQFRGTLAGRRDWGAGEDEGEESEKTEESEGVDGVIEPGA